MAKTPVPHYLTQLHRSLDARLRPEDVLAIIVRGRPSAVPAEWRASFRGAGSGARPAYPPFGIDHSLMSSDFARPVGGARQVASLEKAVGLKDIGWSIKVNGDDPAALRDLVEFVGGTLGGNGRKLTAAERKEADIGLSARKYRRQWRAMRRLHYKADTLDRQQTMRQLELIGRSGFASTIPLERFAADPRAAHFIAYWVARRNLRRQFTLESRKNPMDTVAAWFLRQCVDAENTDWEMIAKACQNSGVMKRLTAEQLGVFFGRWFNVMTQCAGYLKEAWPADVDKTTMIVRAGHDSSTWNTMASAYNNARVNWLACLTALDAEYMLDAACPGKVMRLMAADLAYWHRSAGSDVDPNTKVWAELPMPWEVISGERLCSRAEVEDACQAAGLDPRDSGWTAPRAMANNPVSFECTPELVHGVTVASPEWAALLRRAGVFSGKKITNDSELAAAARHGLEGGVVTSELPTKRPVE